MNQQLFDINVSESDYDKDNRNCSKPPSQVLFERLRWHF